MAFNRAGQEFASPEFDSNQYVSKLCSDDATLADLKKKQADLRQLLDANSGQLKANVFQHHAIYINTSKEISRLEKQLNNVERLLQDQSKIVDSLGEVVSTGSVPGTAVKSHSGRELSQVADLEARHPLIQGEPVHQGLLELIQLGMQAVDKGTYLFLLSKGLVVAWLDSESDRDDQLRLAAVEPVMDMTVRDIIDTEDVSNAFMVDATHGRYMFQAANAADKNTWVRLLRRAIARAEDDEDEDDATEADRVEDLEDWVHSVGEELDVAIAQRAFDNAVALLDKATEYLADKRSRQARQLNNTIAVKTGALASALSSELDRPGLRASDIRKTVYLLLRLGQEETARIKYLSNWSRSIAKDIRALKVEGSTQLFIQKLSSTFFAALRATAAEFPKLFVDDQAGSAYVNWVNQEIQRFASVYQRQVLDSANNTFLNIAECTQVILDEFDSLKELGLDLSFLFWSHNSERLRELIDKEARSWLSLTAPLLVFAMENDWPVVHFSGRQARKEFLTRMEQAGVEHPDLYLEGMKTVLFEATQSFAVDAYEFTSACSTLLHFTTLPLVTDWINRLFVVMVRKVGQAYQEEPDPAKQAIFATNHNFIHDVIFRGCVDRLEGAFHGRIPALAQLETSLEQIWSSLADENEVSDV
eukprot:TRINITY_DN11621_c0_g1_i1.p2 TRINITY_DN11621_c0_g1~~TRINITY_DN11621_c0_g1_i1.p2  ORF type:complete len:646 (+),score=187.70 TRINITY_DN11621_c0_g1_i1:3-1940(+)